MEGGVGDDTHGEEEEGKKGEKRKAQRVEAAWSLGKHPGSFLYVEAAKAATRDLEVSAQYRKTRQMSCVPIREPCEGVQG